MPGTSSRNRRISVPFPTPEGPVTTNSLPRLSPDEMADELTPLALGEPTDRLARRDPALREDLVDLHVAVLGHREQHVGHLRGEDVVRRVAQQNGDVRAPILELPLES